MIIKHISVSRKQLFEECPKKYHFRYHLQVINPEPEKIYFTYGKLIHTIAETYVNEKGQRSINSIANDVLAGKIELEEGKPAPKLPADYMEKMPRHLRCVERIINKTGFGGETEMAFEYDLDPPHQK